MSWVIYLALHAGLLFVLIENVFPCKKFLLLFADVLRMKVPDFLWDVITLRCEDYTLPQVRRRCFLRGARKESLSDTNMNSLPPPLPPFGTAPLKAFLNNRAPNIQRKNLSENLQKNLLSYEKIIRNDIKKGKVPTNAIAAFEVDRAPLGSACPHPHHHHHTHTHKHTSLPTPFHACMYRGSPIPKVGA
jgi:site-specific DNA-cytosine methylase